MMMSVDTVWFDADPEIWLQRDELVHYQELAGVDFRDLKSGCSETLARTQKRISDCSVIMHEVVIIPFLKYYFNGSTHPATHYLT